MRGYTCVVCLAVIKSDCDVLESDSPQTSLYHHLSRIFDTGREGPRNGVAHYDSCVVKLVLPERFGGVRMACRCVYGRSVAIGVAHCGPNTSD